MVTAGGTGVGPVLFLSARVGEGHRAAADAVCERLAVRGIRGDVHDSYRYAASLFSKVVSDGYIGMVRTIPQLYGVIYDRAERATVAGGFRRWAAEFTARNLRPLIEQMRPSAVVCTHAFPCGVMSAYKRLYDSSLPVLGIVTDFVVHPFWIYRNIEAYAVATPEIRAAMIARGVDGARIGVDGIPVASQFGMLPDDGSRNALRARLGIPGDGAMALVMGGGLGLGPLAKTMRALARTASTPTQVVIVGRNRRLEARLQEEAKRDGDRARVLGFVRNVFDWMHAADVLVTKPGGLSTSEALAARVPLVLLPPLPGQEQRNARYLTARGAALIARVPDDLPGLVETAIGAGPRAERLRTAAASLAHPDAAERIAARVAQLAEPVSAPARPRA